MSDTSENKSERFDSDNQINISRLISFLLVVTVNLLKLYVVYFEEINRELKQIRMYECWCDERLVPKS